MESLKVLSYRSYTTESQWSDWVDAGKIVSGSGGITCFNVKYAGIGTIVMQSYIQNEGWSPEVHNDEFCGNIAESKMIQAIRLKIINARGFHIFYRVCFDNQEWSLWKRDFEIAGSVYGNHAICSFEIRIAMEEPHVQYRAYLKNTGWTPMVGDNQIVGYEGNGLRMEALWIHYEGPGQVTLQGYVEGRGWLPEVACDTVCGTVEKGLRLEAIRLNLVELEGYHIYYCSYIKGMGWQPWVKDGEISGTEGASLPIEAVRIRIANCYVC